MGRPDQANGIPVTAVYFAPDHTDSSQYVQYFGAIPESSWADRTAEQRAHHSTTRRSPTCWPQALATSGDAKAEVYNDLGQQMIDDDIIIPIVNPDLFLATRSPTSRACTTAPAATSTSASSVVAG